MDARVTVPGERGPFIIETNSALKARDTFKVPGREGTLRVVEIQIDPQEDEHDVLIIAEPVEPDEA